MSINWGNIGNIATTVGVISGGIWFAAKRLIDRLDHIDECLDRAKAETIGASQNAKLETIRAAQQAKEEALDTAERVKGEVLDQLAETKDGLVVEGAKTRAALQAHLDLEVPHLARIDRTIAWMAGKMGWSPTDFDQ